MLFVFIDVYHVMFVSFNRKKTSCIRGEGTAYPSWRFGFHLRYIVGVCVDKSFCCLFVYFSILVVVLFFLLNYDFWFTCIPLVSSNMSIRSDKNVNLVQTTCSIHVVHPLTKEQRVSGIAYMWYTHWQKNGKSNNSKVF